LEDRGQESADCLQLAELRLVCYDMRKDCRFGEFSPVEHLYTTLLKVKTLITLSI